MRPYVFFTALCFFACFLFAPACRHNSVFDTDPDPTDTTDTGGAGVVCNPDSVYFQNQVLPVLISNCTESGCHSEQDHEDGVVLISYQQLIATVENATLNNWDENKLIRVLTDDDPDDRMPYGKAPLPSAQIDLIKKWIQQGAKNNGCNENSGACETAGVTYTGFVKSLIQVKCQGCHSGNAPQGGINLSTYNAVKTLALNGKLYSAVTRSGNWMPKGGARLDDCTVSKLKAWADAGAPE